MGRRVLLVDDDVDTRDVVAFAVRGLGYEVRSAGNGARALEIAAEWKPQAVLLDLGLPGMDGYEVAAALRALEIRPLRILALSGSDPADARFGLLFDDHMLKPFALERLENKLAEVGRP
jgi:CheY-like chemotaxis protein